MKIDFVVPWVDGADENWLLERQKLTKEIIKNDYRDWDILKYWFRGIEKYAPWVNKIYFITWGHLPSFLNTNHPKLKIVNHKDYIPKEYLPTFSSHTIELNLHRIEDLSENFVYFNDDMFIINKMEKKDFFYKNLPCETAIINPVAPSRYDTICNVMINNTGIINQHFKKNEVISKNIFKWCNYKYGVYNLLNLLFLPWNKFPGFFEHHLPASFKKKTFENIWEKEFEILNNTCLNQIRDFKRDVNQWLIKDWQIAEGNFYPRKKNIGDRFLIDNEISAKKAVEYLKRNKYKMICLNDHITTNDNNEYKEIVEIIKNGLEEKFYEKSSFEL